MFADFPLLSLIIWLPVIGGVGVLLNGDNNPWARPLSLLISVLTLLAALGLYIGFDTTTHQMQFVEMAPWISSYNINYYLGIDGFSLPLIILTAFSTVIVVIAGWQVIEHRTSQYMAAFLIMEGLMIAVFAALDAILFYVFFEAMLIPLFLVIGIWGGPNRVYATIKFFLYTLFGSVFLLLALLYLHHVAGSFSILDYQQVSLSLQEQTWLFFAFLIAFA
ncbi:MAG: proton-conducting transporter membrane subunit, partial [Gammaproteobacteria bacterium]|nr:proton-conducting transporter membrane subunit [Gammaproteobacteria bacterium]